jgi:hypothetical protein
MPGPTNNREVEMSINNPLQKYHKSKDQEKHHDNLLKGDIKKEDATLDTFRKLQAMSAFGKKKPGDPGLSGAMSFMKKKAANIKKTKKQRTGIHSTLEVIRRTSVGVLEDLREEEKKRIERQKELDQIKKRNLEEKRRKGLIGADDEEDDEDIIALQIPPLFPDAFLFSENYGYFKRTWTIVVLLLVCFTTIMIPLDFAFPDMNKDDPDGAAGLNAFGYVVDIIFIIDVILTANTAFIDTNGEENFNKNDIRKNYFKLWFWIDVIACFPLEIIIQLGNAGNGSGNADNDTRAKVLLRLLKIPRLLRIGRIFKYLERFKYAGCWKIFRLILGLVILAHWIGCMFYMIARLEYLEEGTTYEQYMVDENDSSMRTTDKYMQAILMALYMLIGEGVDPNTTLQRFYVFNVNIFGAVVMAVIIGNMSLVLQNQNAMSAMFTSKMDFVGDSMRAMKVSPKLQDKVLSYYDYLWSRHRLVSTKQSFVDELSPCLQKEVNLDLNMDVIQKCGLFRALLMEGRKLDGMVNQEIADHVLVQVVTNLTREVYLPGDIIIQQGETGREMYFLIKGDVAVEKMVKFDENGSPVIKRLVVLHEGTYFGELALLRGSSEKTARRAASIVAVTNCDVRIFHRDDFNRVCDDFPQLRVYLKSEAEKKYAGFKKDEKKKPSPIIKGNKAPGKATPPMKPMSNMRSLAAKVRSKTKKPFSIGSSNTTNNSITLPSRTRSLLSSPTNQQNTEALNAISKQCQRMENMMQTLITSMEVIDNRLSKVENGTTNGGLRTFPTKRTTNGSPNISNVSVMKNMRRMNRKKIDNTNAEKKTNNAKFARSNIINTPSPRPPNGRSPRNVSRTTLSDEHIRKLHQDVSQASTNARAVVLLSRRSNKKNNNNNNRMNNNNNRGYKESENPNMR